MKKLSMMIMLMMIVSVSQAQETVSTSTFEDGASTWKGRGSAVIAVTNEDAYKGKYSLLTTKRSQAWNGPSVDLTGKVLPSGVYNVSVWVKIKEGQPESEMILSVERSINGTQGWDRIAAMSAKPGKWINLTGSYQAKNNFDKISAYVESSNATLEYFIDDCVISMVRTPDKKITVADDTEKDIPSLYEHYTDFLQIGTCAELDQFQGDEGAM
ncbi:MAG TPA: carbohydrate binding domain-containing protein, partial [Spirochaetota bacterium]